MLLQQKGRFSVLKHSAERAGDHWDIRLTTAKPENKVWSVVSKAMRVPSSGKPVLCIQTEHHDIKSLDFEGKIPEGEYGAGTVRIHDSGTYELIRQEEGKLYAVKLKGKKISGDYSFALYVRKDAKQSDPKEWLWVKMVEKNRNVSEREMLESISITASGGAVAATFGRLGGMSGQFAAGPGGYCVCPACGYRKKHAAGNPCYSQKCAKCGTTMIRQGIL